MSVASVASAFGSNHQGNHHHPLSSWSGKLRVTRMRSAGLSFFVRGLLGASLDPWTALGLGHCTRSFVDARNGRKEKGTRACIVRMARRGASIASYDYDGIGTVRLWKRHGTRPKFPILITFPFPTL